jgi:hypothetical protein
MNKYNPERDVTDAYRSRVKQWITETGEVFIVLRYLNSGSRGYSFCRTHDEFDSLLDVVPVGTDVIVFLHRQLPLRGIASESLLSEALIMVPEGTEYMLVRIFQATAGDPRLSGSMGDTHQGLREDFLEHFGFEVAFGPCPNFSTEDHAAMISASKGGMDGPR